jgi:hypothetical protein
MDSLTETVLEPLTWPQRIENYRREIGVPYLAYENGWTFGTWFMGNNYQKRSDIYGGYQGNILRRMHVVFPDRRRPLHLFSGKVDLSTFPGDTVDIRAELNPTYCCNAETCEGVPLHKYDFVLADPPYSASDAEHYGTPMVSRNKVVKTLAAGLPLGRIHRVAGSGLSDVFQGTAEDRSVSGAASSQLGLIDAATVWADRLS